MKANKIILSLAMIIIILIIIVIVAILLINTNNKKNTNVENAINNVDINLINQEISEKQEVKEANQFEYANISDDSMSIYYFNMCIEDLLYNKERGYKTLDEEYREKRFGNIDAFTNYVQQNKTELENAILQKYQKKSYDNYTQYVLVDQYDNYYIIRETAVMQYSVVLDTYTIDLPEYIEKYNSSGEQQKVALCIDRIIKAVNDKNYKFAYSKLSEGFKNNYFKTEQSFESYIKQKLPNQYDVTYLNFGNEGNLYTCKVRLTDSNSNAIEKTFIVKLGEGTNFELSFNVE